MMTTELLLRKPVDADIESMYIMLENSLSPYLTVNDSSSRNLQLIIDRNIVEDYVKRDVYLCLVVEINSEIAGWLAGSSKIEVLSEHRLDRGHKENQIICYLNCSISFNIIDRQSIFL